MSFFQYISPQPFLAPYVKQYWVLEDDFGQGSSERIIPTGNMQICFYRGDNKLIRSGNRQQIQLGASVISGHSTDFSDINPNGKIRIITVVFHPQGANCFFRLPLGEIANHKVSPDDLSDKEMNVLEKRISDTDDIRECIRFIETFLLTRLHLSGNQERMYAAIRLINRNPYGVRMKHLSEEVCLSEKQFRRLFVSHIGINPKDFIRTVRFQYALSLAQNNPDIPLSHLAFDSGYYDQPHLINEFKQFSGLTPKEFFSICTPSSDYFNGQSG